MKEFMMIFRAEERVERSTAESMQAQLDAWQNWIGGIAAQDKYVSTNAVGMQAAVVKADGSSTNGPLIEGKNMLGGYIIVKADDLQGAIKLSAGCPTFSYGGTVEVRDVMVFN